MPRISDAAVTSGDYTQVYMKNNLETMSENNSFTFHFLFFVQCRLCFFHPSYLSAGEKKILHTQKPSLETYLSFYSPIELNCALSHTSINQNESMDFRRPPPDLSLHD